MPCRVAHEFALRYVGDIPPPKGELHNALALAGKQCPARTGLRVLLDAVNVIVDVIEAHRAKFLGPCRRNRVRLPLQLDSGLPLGNYLPSDLDQGFSERHRWTCYFSAAGGSMPSVQGGITIQSAVSSNGYTASPRLTPQRRARGGRSGHQDRPARTGEPSRFGPGGSSVGKGGADC